MLTNSDSLIINTLRFIGTADASSIKRYANEAFSAGYSMRAIVPPSSVLCVRKLYDPLHGRLQLGAYQGGCSSSWNQAFNAKLRRALERAKRPAREPVGSNAEAVFFADPAELMACLAKDWCDGSVLSRWWWKSVFRESGVARAVVSA